jgi:hypothetical protein
MTNYSRVYRAAYDRPLSHLSAAARFAAFCLHVAAWVRTCADYYYAAAAYEQLSGKSDAELRRLGMSRETLGWDVSPDR